MAIVSRAQLKMWFKRGLYPLQSQFYAWIDSYWHKDEDSIPVSAIDGLADILNQKADSDHTHAISEVNNLQTTLDGKSDTDHTHTAADTIDFTEAVETIIAQHDTGETQIHDVIYVEDLTALEAIEDPAEDVLYITEDTGYLYKYRNGEFELIEDDETPESEYIIVVGSFTTLENRLKNYQTTGAYNVVLIQTNNSVATYRFVCSATSNKISQTLTKDQRDGTEANTRTRTGTVTTVNDQRTVSWSAWTIRTPLYKENLDTSLSATSTNAVQNKTVKTALDGKADTDHSHAIADVTGLQTALDGKQPTGNYLTEHQDISGKQDKTDNTLQTTDKTVAGAINELAGQVKVRTYTIDFQTYTETAQDMNVLAAMTITKVVAHNISALYITYGNVTHQAVTLNADISLQIPVDTRIFWECVRTTDNELACVGIKATYSL